MKHTDFISCSSEIRILSLFDLELPTVCNLLLNVSVFCTSDVFLFTSHTGCFGHIALPSLCLRSTGL